MEVGGVAAGGPVGYYKDSGSCRNCLRVREAHLLQSSDGVMTV